MYFGFVLPSGSADQQLELAVLADAHGWDGVFVWESAYGIDAWTLLGAIAARTSHIRLGTMLTPLPWRRPWKVASQVLTLDQISNGRAILAIGLGAVDPFMGTTNEELDRQARAEMMDEGIDLIRGLWNGQLTYSGKHYQMDLSGRTDLITTANSVQARIPIWTVGAWPREKSMTRLLRCDGILPNVWREDHWDRAEPGDVQPMLAWLRNHGGAGDGFDFVVEGTTPTADAVIAGETVKPFAEAGATWWLEADWSSYADPRDQQEHLRTRIEAGPPRF
ncbi:MAG TPA: LLM class flavin-dependent oxidoreductase [Thermomicrobiales bacterium]|nr:LLM class flavin-dependent oxidoreductase [Thermomicrobiales bacterium]